jgi:hypothetical protein
MLLLRAGLYLEDLFVRPELRGRGAPYWTLYRKQL